VARDRRDKLILLPPSLGMRFISGLRKCVPSASLPAEVLRFKRNSIQTSSDLPTLPVTHEPTDNQRGEKKKKKLAPGTKLTLQNGQCVKSAVRVGYRFQNTRAPFVAPGQVDRTRQRRWLGSYKAAIKRQLISDVPVGLCF